MPEGTFEAQVTANVSQGVSGMSEFAQAVEKVTKSSEGMQRQFEGLRSTAEGLASRFDMLRNIFGAGATVFGFEQLIKGAVDFDTQIQKLSATLNGDVVAASQWNAVAEHMGVNSEALLRGFARLSMNVDSMKPLLGSLGIATQDASGRLLSMNDILLNAADYFSAHAGATNNAAIAQQLFGRSAVDLLPVLTQGRGAINTITEEAKKYGLVLDETRLKQDIVFAQQMKQGEMAVRGLAVSLGNALLPGIAAAAQGLADFVSRHLQDFINAVNKAVSWIIGIGEAFGLWDSKASDAAVTLAQVAQATNDYGDATGPANAGTKAMTEAMKDLQQATNQEVGALNEQIRTLDERQRAFTANIQGQIRDLNELKMVTNFDYTQTRVKDQEAQKQKDIERARQQYVLELALGEFQNAQNTKFNITRMTQELTQLQRDYTKNSSDEQIRIKVDALKNEEATQRSATDLQKQALTDQVQAVKAAEQQKLQAMQDSMAGGVAAVRSGTLAIPPLFDASGKDAASKFNFALNSDAEKNGRTFADNIRTGIRNQDWAKVGTDIGTEVALALATEVGRRAIRQIGQNFQDGIIRTIRTGGGLTDFVNAFGQADSWISGAFVPQGARAGGGPVSRGQWLVGERGPEVVSISGPGTVSSNDDMVGALMSIGDKLDALRGDLAVASRGGGGDVASMLAAAAAGMSYQSQRGIRSATFP